ncbi:MAG: ABC transporter permease [Candidatus Thorarchaeota archaeon]|nr:MAG: ABC transporter permease [Candidatus Thorarchaeota archaeon]
MFRYAFKRVSRGYRLFIALTIGVLVATTFFSAMVVSADVTSREALLTALDEVDYDLRVEANNVTWTTSDMEELEGILGGMPEISSTDVYTKVLYPYNETPGTAFNVIGLNPQSAAWQTMELINGSASLGANETYIVASSVNATALTDGEILQVPIRVQTTEFPFSETYDLNLTVAGYVDIPERTARLLNPPRYLNLGFIQIEIGDWRHYNLLIVDWESTMSPLIDMYSSMENVTRMYATTGYACQLDRDLLINPYDVGASSTAINDLVARIEDRTAVLNTDVTNLVGSTLTLISLMSAVLILAFVSLAAPIIFMSWYSSTMLSDVSYNLRRREFGLLSAKGLGPRPIRRMLLFEGIIIGLVGGVLGLVAGTILGHMVVGVTIDNLLLALTGNLMTAAFVVVFALVLAYWSVRGPSSRASKLDPLDALKQYVYIEEQREYKRFLPTIALVLGTYKIVAWVVGINMQTVLSGALSTNFLLLILTALFTPIDAFLNFAGPILFLYGVTKILLRGSQKFQEGIVQAGSRFFGAFGRLATRNVKRNPSRNAALVFVIALIVSYGIFSVGGLFSEEDRIIRTALYDVGSDVSATFSAGEDIFETVDEINELDGVDAVTLEYRMTLSTTRGSMEVRAISPENWSDAAFYEEIWFSGATLEEIFSNFTDNKILLSVSVARQLDLRIGNFITLRGTGASDVHRMEIVGFVGFVSPFEGMLGDFARFVFGGTYPSYIPRDYLNSSGLVEYAEGYVLIKTEDFLNGTELEEVIVDIAPEVENTASVTSMLKASEENTFEGGGTRARWVGVVFAVVLAVVGTGLVVGLTLKEKEYETTLLSVRGFSRGQVLKVLLAEIMVMVLFSLLLGVGTGFIQLFGDLSNQSQNLQALVRPIVVLSAPAVLGMVTMVLAVIGAAVVPIAWASRFTEGRVDVLRE